MALYFAAQTFTGVVYAEADLNLKEFEDCTFINCDFSACNFMGVTFVDCTFDGCHFIGTRINHVALRTVEFRHCKIIDVNFAMCDKLIFEIHFTDCQLDFSKFYTLKIRNITFTRCSLLAVDFMKADLTSALFDACDMHKATFVATNLSKADFRSSFNYTLDPERNTLSKTLFSLDGVKGLLAKHDIVVV